METNPFFFRRGNTYIPSSDFEIVTGPQKHRSVSEVDSDSDSDSEGFPFSCVYREVILCHTEVWVSCRTLNLDEQLYFASVIFCV